jgi:hypothetical protein
MNSHAELTNATSPYPHVGATTQIPAHTYPSNPGDTDSFLYDLGVAFNLAAPHPLDRPSDCKEPQPVVHTERPSMAELGFVFFSAGLPTPLPAAPSYHCKPILALYLLDIAHIRSALKSGEAPLEPIRRPIPANDIQAALFALHHFLCNKTNVSDTQKCDTLRQAFDDFLNHYPLTSTREIETLAAFLLECSKQKPLLSDALMGLSKELSALVKPTYDSSSDIFMP